MHKEINIPPASVMIALVAACTLNSSAANLSTAVKGASSGTLTTWKGCFGSLASVILNCTEVLLMHEKP